MSAAKRVALVNPPWSFEGSTYFGCREPHLPLEFGYARRMLEDDGVQVLLVDGHLDGLTIEACAHRVADFVPDMTVVATAPSYLFWRCPQPELRVPRAFVDCIGRRGGVTVAVGPHGSVTPGAVLDKIGVDVVVIGECEDVLARLARSPWAEVAGVAFREADGLVVTGPPQAARFIDAAPLTWADDVIGRHLHHHHRFDEGRRSGSSAPRSRLRADVRSRARSAQSSNFAIGTGSATRVS